MTTLIDRLRSLLAFIGPRFAAIIVVLWGLSVAYFLLEILFAFVLQQFLASLGVLPPSPHRVLPPALSTPWATTAILALVGAGRVALTYVQTVVDGVCMERFCHRLRVELVARSIRSTAIDSGAALTFFHRTIMRTAWALRGFQMLVSQGILCLGLAVSLIGMSPRLTVIFLFIGALGAFPFRLLHRRVRVSAARQKEAFDRVMESLGHVFRNLPLIRLHNLQNLERRNIESHLGRYGAGTDSHLRSEGAAAGLSPLFVVVGIVGVAVGHRAGLVATDTLVPYLYLFIRLAQNCGTGAALGAGVSGMSADFALTFGWWTAGRHDREAEAGSTAEVEPVTGPIGWHLNDVTFGYEGQPPLFSDFTLRVSPGSLVRIAGPSGSGKTTLLAMMTGEIAPIRGDVEVELDGECRPIAELLTRLREHLGYASADPYLFGGTIYDNVVYGLHEPPTDAFLREMADCAGCEFILQMPAGFLHRIDEHGHGLSTGQQQRISLLRALLRRPKALVLDEALSNLDDVTEDRILRNLLNLRPSCTTVWVSHRAHAGLAADDGIEVVALQATPGIRSVPRPGVRVIAG